MGLSVHPGINPIPVEVLDGRMKYRIGSQEYEYDIPALRGFKFKKQCIMFRNPCVRAFLSDGTYIAVLRFDGTGVIFLLDGEIFVKNFTYNNEGFEEFRSGGNGCILSVDKRSVPKTAVTLATCDGRNYVISCDLPISGTFDLVQEAEYAQDILRTENPVFPVYKVDGRSMIAWNCNNNTEVYRLHTELFRADGFTA